jgi:hypothetical protein
MKAASLVIGRCTFVLFMAATGLARLPPLPQSTFLGLRGGGVNHDRTQTELNLQLAGKLMPAFTNALLSTKSVGLSLTDTFTIYLALDLMVRFYSSLDNRPNSPLHPHTPSPMFNPQARRAPP